MPEVVIKICVPADEYIKVYRGSARTVLCETLDGRRVRFPADILQKFVTRSGVEGQFRIIFDQQGRYQRIEKIA